MKAEVGKKFQEKLVGCGSIRITGGSERVGACEMMLRQPVVAQCHFSACSKILRDKLKPVNL